MNRASFASLMKGSKMPKGRGKATVKAVMKEFKSGKLRSGSKSGPKVTNQKQAVAIALSEAKPKRK